MKLVRQPVERGADVFDLAAAVVMLSGDVETCSQARALFGASFVTAPVKEAIGRVAARMLP